MAQAKRLTLHRRARRTLDVLSPGERANVERAMNLLIDPTAADFVKANVHRLKTPERTYLMRATPDIRVFFDSTPDGVQVLDVVRRDKLESIAEASSSSRPENAATSAAPARRSRSKRAADEDR